MVSVFLFRHWCGIDSETKGSWTLQNIAAGKSHFSQSPWLFCKDVWQSRHLACAWISALHALVFVQTWRCCPEMLSELALAHLHKEACFTSNPSSLSLPQISPPNLFLGKSSCSKEKSYCSGSLPTFKYTTTVVNKQLTNNFTQYQQLTQHSVMTSVSKHSEPIYGPLIAMCTYLMERFAFILMLLLFCKRHGMSEK